MAWVIKLIHLVSGQPTPHDGRYLSAYDPHWLSEPVPEPFGGGRYVRALETTDNMADALRFASVDAAMSLAAAVSPNRPVRPDGKPNRPLRAFTLEFIPES